MSKPKVLTTAAGIPVCDNQTSLTAGDRGPTLLQDHHLLEKLAHFNRERIPERVVHAKAAGAHGTFIVTKDITRYTKARIFSEVGKKTDVFGRFSTVAGEKGSADTVRNVRGFALKFYTEEGNWDMVGNNTPVFFVRDAIKFPDFVHTQKREPQTNLRSEAMVWDFWSQVPESLHQITILFSDRGIPKGIPFMHGFGSHTYSFINASNERFWVKFHFKTQQGIQNMTPENAIRIAGENSDYHTRQLFEVIERGDYPKWTFYVQVMPEAEAETYQWNPFDLTKVWPHADAQRYRLGVNFERLPINRPLATVANTYQRDGFMRFDDNGGASVNYEPNSFGGPKADPTYNEPPLKISGDANRYEQKRGVDDDFVQPGNLFRLMPPDERKRLIKNIVASLKKVPKDIQERMVPYFYKADKVLQRD